MKKKREKLKESVHIGDVLYQALRTFRPASDDKLVRVWSLWDSALGADIAENARPAAFKGSILLVHVVSSPWIHHLQFQKTDMIHRINQALGETLIEEIKFKIGPIRE